MSVELYMDVHVKRSITDGLRLRSVNVLTAQEDRAAEFEDTELLDRPRNWAAFSFRRTTTCCAKHIKDTKEEKLLRVLFTRIN